MMKGLTMAFMLLLSAQEGLTFTISKDLLSCFPFDDYELEAEVDEKTGTTTFSLIPLREKAH
jgi:hypothetical protein